MAAGYFTSITRWASVRRRRYITILIGIYDPIMTIPYVACAIIVTDDIYIHEEFEARCVGRSRSWIALLILIYDPVSTLGSNGALEGRTFQLLRA